MTILAQHPKKGRMTFDKRLFQQIKQMEPEWVIINHDYEGTFKQEIKIEKIEKAPEVVDMKPIVEKKDPIVISNDFNPKDYSVTKFRQNIDNFSISELQILEKDDRKTIAKEAKKQLRKLIS